MRTEKVVLSERMQAMVDMVTPGRRVVDVGCDHGFVSIALVQQGVSPFVLAMDVRKGPLAAAREHIKEWNLEAYIETRLSDGLMSYRVGEADTAIIAGMGGRLMMRILKESREKVETLSELILQPQSELETFRHFLNTGGYQVLGENILLEEGKYYFLFRVIPAGKGVIRTGSEVEKVNSYLTNLYEKYGRGLLEERHPVLQQYLLRELALSEEIRKSLHANPTQRSLMRLAEVEKDIADLHSALNFFE